MERTLPFGAVAVDLGMISTRQLARALITQRRERLLGWPHRKLGAILLDFGDLTPDQVDSVLDAQKATSRLRLSPDRYFLADAGVNVSMPVG